MKCNQCGHNLDDDGHCDCCGNLQILIEKTAIAYAESVDNEVYERLKDDTK